MSDSKSSLFCITYDFIILSPIFKDNEKSVLNLFQFYFNPLRTVKYNSVNYQTLSTDLNKSVRELRRIITAIDKKITDNNIPISLKKIKNKKTNEIEFIYSCTGNINIELNHSGNIEAEQKKYILEDSIKLLLMYRGFTQYYNHRNCIKGKHLFEYDNETILRAISVFEYYNRKSHFQKDIEKRKLQIFEFQKLLKDSIQKGYYKDYEVYNINQDIMNEQITNEAIYNLIVTNLEKINSYTNNDNDLNTLVKTLLHRQLNYKYLKGIENELFENFNKNKVKNNLIEYFNNKEKYISKIKIQTNENNITKPKRNKFNKLRTEQLQRAGRAFNAIGNIKH